MRIGAIALVFVVLSLVLLYFLVWNASKDELARATGSEERTLRERVPRPSTPRP